ncbi:protein asunder [Nasonia vitripennis]|uniref:Protein asunder n=1 Tax=Nasonia vitripennis TaxID=7425 RepID=A0A7M7LQE2_NASVI|nr:protein asunder [Nasonia vitripennis]XP_008203006.1 protein asunder [Nasonia vitripennis]
MYPANHKTVFVLDHTPYFGIPSENDIDFDFVKSRTPTPANTLPLPKISKSLWTTSIETSMEYCRIAWDLFPTDKLIRFVVSDHSAHILNTWNPSQQTLAHIMNGMAIIGVPPRNHQQGVDFSVIHGLRVAIEALTECSETQQEIKARGGEPANKLINRGRVICITSARDDMNMKSLENIFLNQLIQQNKQAANVDANNLIPIHNCHLVILNISPMSIESQVTSQNLREVSPLLSMEVHSLKAPVLHSKLSHLILSHYDLASTTVTGIPMKEEQNASSSANYDVEIFHSHAAHLAILKGHAQDTALVKSFRRFDEGIEYETVTLKWCTPRGCSAGEMQNCTAMHRITPVDVNSRPSSCLINFLLNGRSVMLEMARKSGGKTISHLLASHGGEIFIHTLPTSRSVLEDPPSISEGCGGRVTDYRITDFAALMRANTLVPLKRKPDDTDGPVERMRPRFERFTKYWPITLTSTMIFNVRSIIDPLPDLILKEELTKEEVVQCKQIIFSLLALEAKHETLPLPSLGCGRGGKSGKRDEHYMLLWRELETFLEIYSTTSSAHLEVLNCLLEVRNKEDKDNNKVELDQALRELDGLDKEDVTARATVIRATTDSPMSPPPCPSASLAKQLHSKSLYALPRSLLDIWLQRSAPKDRRPDFHGRVNSDGPRAKLYPNLKENNQARENRNSEPVEA